MNTPDQAQALQEALDEQQAMVESALELVFQTYDDGVAEGMQQPVVWLLDCEDPIGGQIARGWLGDEAVDDALAAAEDEDATLFARPVSWEVSKAETPSVFPYLADAFETPPTDGLMVIGVTAGGASAIIAPLAARPTE